MSKPHRSNTLDRLQRFSFGGSRSNSKDRKNEETGETRKSSSRNNSEKTERLRELTEKLKGLSPQIVRSPVPKRPNRRLPPTVKSTKSNVEQTPPSYRKIPFKSVSFSQVDFSSVDGKYTRRKNSSTPPIDAKEEPETLIPTLLTQATIDSRSLTHPLGKRAQVHSRGRTVQRKSQTFDDEDIPALAIPSVVDDINNQYKSECDTKLSESTSELSDKVRDEASLDRISPNEQPRSRNSSSSSSADKSRKRKGIYITKWPTSIDTTKEILGVESDSIPTIYLQDGSSDNEACWTKLQDDCTPEDWYGDPFNGPEWPKVTKPKIESTKPCNLLVRVDSLSESESEHRNDYLTSSRPSIHSDKSDISDCEQTSSNSPRRYSKRPLRGPYGQMLEAEMKKPETNKIFSKLYYNKELKFLDDLMASSGITNDSLRTPDNLNSSIIPAVPNVVRTRGPGNRSLDETHLKPQDDILPVQRTPAHRKTGAIALNSTNNSPLSSFVRHQRTTSSPSKLEGIVTSMPIEPTLRPTESSLKSSTECLLTAQTFLENNPNAHVST